MSEEERRSRFNYRRIRKIEITVLAVVLTVFLCLTFIMGGLAVILNKTYYVNYTEKSSIDYGVHLKSNDFYNDEFIGKDYAYIASLIDSIEASFNYGVKMESHNDMEFKYSYRIDSVVEIKDRNSGKLLYAPVHNEIPGVTGTVTGKDLELGRTLLIDYGKYNDIAEKFIKTYQLRDVSANLSVQMIVDVTSVSEEFHEDSNKNSYVSSISVPLTADTVEVRITSAIPAENQKILSYTTENVASVFRNIAYVLAAVTALIAIWFVAFVYLSRNVDITYEIRVKRIVSSYKSFIQKLLNEFDTKGYQVLKISSFKEMLEVRDTIQSPILMHENDDRTCTKFIIPTNTNLLYLYELKVDDYDRIYGIDKDSDGNIEEKYSELNEEPEALESENCAADVSYGKEMAELITEASSPEEAADSSAVKEEDGAEAGAKDDTYENTEALTVENILDHLVEEAGSSEDAPSVLSYIDLEGKKVEITCTRSFSANLIQSNPQVKSYYNELKNYIMSFKKIKSRISWRMESFNRGRTNLFKLKIRGKTICLYCALNPDDFDKAKYFHEKSEAKTFAAVPMMVRIKSDRGLKRAKTLIDLVMARFEITADPKVAELDFVEAYPYDTTKNLVQRGLIKILLDGFETKEPESENEVVKTETASESIGVDADEPSEADGDISETDTSALENILSHLAADGSEGSEGDDTLAYIDDEGKRVTINCARSFTANLIQSNPQVKSYYNELKNYIMSFKKIKSRINWRMESFNRGRTNLFKLKIRGKTICLYCALNPDDFDKAKYFHEKSEAKTFAAVPMMVRIKSDRGLKRAKTLIDLVMARFEITADSKWTYEDYASAYPYDTTRKLVERKLVKLLLPGATAAEPKPHHHAHKSLARSVKE